MHRPSALLFGRHVQVFKEQSAGWTLIMIKVHGNISFTSWLRLQVANCSLIKKTVWILIFLFSLGFMSYSIFLKNKLLFMLLSKGLLPVVDRSQYYGTRFWEGNESKASIVNNWQGDRSQGSNLSPQSRVRARFKKFQPRSSWTTQSQFLKRFWHSGSDHVLVP